MCLRKFGNGQFVGRNYTFVHRRLERLCLNHNLLDVDHAHTAILVIFLLVRVEVFVGDILLNFAIFQSREDLRFRGRQTVVRELNVQHIALTFVCECTDCIGGRIGVVQALDAEFTLTIIAQQEVLESFGVAVIKHKLRALGLAVEGVGNSTLDCLRLLETNGRQSGCIAYYIADVETTPAVSHHQQIGVLACSTKILGRSLDETTQIRGQQQARCDVLGRCFATYHSLVGNGDSIVAVNCVI